MDSLKNKRFHKVISLFIKSLILILSFWYIYEKLKTADNFFALLKDLRSDQLTYLIVAILLMFINWGLEAVKWKMLIAPLEQISFSSSLRSVFAGVTVSIFTPNRIGEFAGRVFYLETADKIKASLMSIAGSLLQLLVTIIAGIAAYFILSYYQYDILTISRVSSSALSLLILTATLLVLLFLFLYFKRDIFINYKKYAKVFSSYSAIKVSSVFGLSVIRYIVFSVQFYLILKLFGIEGEVMVLFALIAFSFFVISAIPTFAFTEIAVRGATAVYFFNCIGADASNVVAASLLLWMINLALPALIGSLFVWKLKFFKD